MKKIIGKVPCSCGNNLFIVITTGIDDIFECLNCKKYRWSPDQNDEEYNREWNKINKIWKNNKEIRNISKYFMEEEFKEIFSAYEKRYISDPDEKSFKLYKKLEKILESYHKKLPGVING